MFEKKRNRRNFKNVKKKETIKGKEKLEEQRK